MNKKGFTLIELLASLVILSIIMLVAVPSTLSILDKNKKETYVNDAKKMISIAEAEFRTNKKIDYPTSNQIVLLYLSYINNGDIVEDPNGNTYSNDSFVAVTYNGDENSYSYNYSVHMFGVKGTSTQGIELSSIETLKSSTRYNSVKSGIGAMSCSQISQVVLGNTSGTCVTYK